MNKKTLYWIIAILIIFNVSTLFKMKHLEDAVKSSNQQMNNLQFRLENDISQVYYRVDEMLKKQASILDTYELTFGDLDPDKLAVPVTVFITPKEYTDAMAASLQINDKGFIMQRSGTTFSVTADVYIFDDFEPKINLKSNGIIKTETIQGYNGLHSKYLLEIFGGFSGESSASSTYYKYNGEIHIDIKSPEKPVKVSIVTEVNGKILNEKPVGPSQVISVPVDEKVTLKKGDKLVIYAKVQDKYGLNYKYIILDHNADDDNLSNTQNYIDIQGALEVSDKNGKILFTKNYRDVK